MTRLGRFSIAVYTALLATAPTAGAQASNLDAKLANMHTRICAPHIHCAPRHVRQQKFHQYAFQPTRCEMDIGKQ
jgi:hypothetical protein